MKTYKSLIALTALLGAFFALLFFAVPAVHAQDASVPAATAPDIVTAVIVAAAAKYPAVVTIASLFGALAGLYQVLLAWAHKRVAETSDPEDDKWLAALEAKTWFKVLDRVFNFGAYIGAKVGGRKL